MSIELAIKQNVIQTTQGEELFGAPQKRIAHMKE